MRILRWLKLRLPRVKFERVSAVRCCGAVIELKWPLRSNAEVAIEEIRRVTIQTTDEGPFDCDVFFVVETIAGRRCFIPQDLAGADDLLILLQKLPGFDNKAVIEAMACVEDRKFLCWEKA
jgi:hypothetical protein